eukprot:GHUV01048008.1.p1 GENE.GHUV01048008.1~~GHUV01048008.1.p1  ORF type:complete len:103 (+),score=4.20 GHUV01048008.1:207-515(+)
MQRAHTHAWSAVPVSGFSQRAPGRRVRVLLAHLVITGLSTASIDSPIFSIRTECPASIARSMTTVMLSAPMRMTYTRTNDLVRDIRPVHSRVMLHIQAHLVH